MDAKEMVTVLIPAVKDVLRDDFDFNEEEVKAIIEKSQIEDNIMHLPDVWSLYTAKEIAFEILTYFDEK